MFVRISLAAFVAALALAALAAQPSGAGHPDVRYVVRPGDTLWALAAARYPGDPREGVWRIRERNDLDARAVLAPGRMLYLPAGK